MICMQSKGLYLSLHTWLYHQSLLPTLAPASVHTAVRAASDSLLQRLHDVRAPCLQAHRVLSLIVPDLSPICTADASVGSDAPWAAHALRRRLPAGASLVSHIYECALKCEGTADAYIFLYLLRCVSHPYLMCVNDFDFKSPGPHRNE